MYNWHRSHNLKTVRRFKKVVFVDELIWRITHFYDCQRASVQHTQTQLLTLRAFVENTLAYILTF